VINRPPQIVCLAIDLDEDLVQRPPPVRVSTHSASPVSADLGGEHRAKSVPPEPDRFGADPDAALMQQVLHISKQKGKSDVQHHGQSYDLGARLEVAKEVEFCHPAQLGRHPARL